MRKLLRVDIVVPDQEDLIESLTAWLTERASQGWEELPEGDLVRLRVHLEDTPSGREFAAEAAAAWPTAGITPSVIEEEDWGAAWMAFFTPIEVGCVYEVLPPWLADKDTGDLRPILIEPKMAFGTGHHPTTALCLELFAEAFRAGRIKAGMRFLDLGTGSGILGIGLAKLGLTGIGLDIDPQAVACAADNARLNAVSESFELAVGGVGSLRAGVTFDVVAANILSAPLIAMAGKLAARKAPDGLLVLSGILETQAADVAAAYRAAGLPEPKRRFSGEWAALAWD